MYGFSHQFNRSLPAIMHVDLNSCFARAEQQANPHLRGKPLVVAAYATNNGCVLSPSTEAKQYGIKTGMRVRDARLLCPGVLVRAPDAPKYRDIHMRFMRIFREYSPDVSPRSIDEAVIDFSVFKSDTAPLVGIAEEIKARIRGEIGEWITCSIGISTNRFLAKLAASLHKPDGLDIITYKTAPEVYKRLKLTDLPGINIRMQTRLQAAGIWSPYDFFCADARTLHHTVFQSIIGPDWYLRLRGWEVSRDAVEWERKSYGNQYALSRWTDNEGELLRILMKLTEKTGRRLRKGGYTAGGVIVSARFGSGSHWGKGQKIPRRLTTTMELYEEAQRIFSLCPKEQKVALLSVSCFDLLPTMPVQELLFPWETKRRNLARAIDAVNDRFGEFTAVWGRMTGMKGVVLDRISFGGVRELEHLYPNPQCPDRQIEGHTSSQLRTSFEMP